MVKRIIVQQFSTIDGFAAHREGGMGFQQAYVARNDRAFQEDALEFLESVDPCS